MGKTSIEWTDASWNPLRGCSRVSAGCENCYAETIAKRFSGPGQPYEGTISERGKWNGNITFHPDKLIEPLKWRKPRRVFVNSMSDLFHEHVKDEWIDQIFAVMALTPHITYQVLTKRPERMADYVRSISNYNGGLSEFWLGDAIHEKAPFLSYLAIREARIDKPLPNCWIGVSVEDQKTAKERIPHLLGTPAAVRFLSIEPLLGPVDLTLRWGGGETRDKYGDLRWGSLPTLGAIPGPNIDWVIVGGESGPDARPMHPGWVRSIRDQCVAAGVPFFFKQWGEYWPFDPLYVDKHPFGPVPNDWDPCLEYCWPDSMKPGVRPFYSIKLGKAKAGRILDGRTWDEFPEVKK